jgi:DNA-binding MarR family transcriptional regulator
MEEAMVPWTIFDDGDEYMSAVLSAPASVDALGVASVMLLAVRTLEHKLRAIAGADALTLTDIGVLSQIEEGVDLPSQVARALRLDPARVTHVTDRLVEFGFMERAIDSRDRRCWRLRLTDAGKARLEEARVDTKAAVEALLEGLSPEESAALMNGLLGLQRELFMGSATHLRLAPLPIG